MGFNRGDAPYRWEIPLRSGETLAQIFTASGRVDQFPIEQHADRAIVAVPECDGIVLRVDSQE